VTVPPADAGQKTTGLASVLLAEHEPEVAEMSARYLRRDGLHVRLVTSPEPTLAELTSGPDAAAVIDLTMPGLDPRRIRRALRTPVIFLVAGSGGLRPRGLAIQRQRRWLARPFSPRQLVTMVREVITEEPGRAKRTVPKDPNAGAWRLDTLTRSAVADGHRVPLTATEFAVLARLAENPGRVVSRAELLAAAGRHGAGERAADVHIAQLRAKLGGGQGAQMIRTIRGVGYTLAQEPSPT
jgi:DNA-binding response OmpR family regulator